MLQNDTNAKLNRSIKVYGSSYTPPDSNDYEFGVIEAVHQAVHEGKMHTISLQTYTNDRKEVIFWLKLKVMHVD